jgi:hypothetical protein
VPLILICNYHKHGISCVWYWTYMVSVLAVLLLTVSGSGRLLVRVWWWMAFCPGVAFTSSGGE